MQSLAFNSVENEFCEDIIGGSADLVKWRVNIEKKTNYVKMKFTFCQIRTLINQMKEYGVGEESLFDENDLIERTNIPKVTRCLKQIAVIVSSIIRKCKNNLNCPEMPIFPILHPVQFRKLFSIIICRLLMMHK